MVRAECCTPVAHMDSQCLGGDRRRMNRRGRRRSCDGVAVIAAAVLLLTGCDAPPTASDLENAAPNSRRVTTSTWTDPDSGCRYIMMTTFVHAGVSIALAPKLRADGSPDCGR